MEIELVVTFVILGFTAVAVVVGVITWRTVGAGAHLQCQQAESSTPSGHWPWTLTWLVCLSVATCILLVVQLLVGYVTGALVLVADAAHASADCATYGFAAFVEYLKMHFGAYAMSPGLTGRIDRASACFSVAVVVAAALAVTAEAASRLHRGGSARGGHGNEDLGGAMLGVAGVGLALNLSLLLIHWCCRPDGAAQLQQFSSASGRLGAIRRRLSEERREGLEKEEGRRCCGIPSSHVLGVHAVLHPGCAENEACSAGAVACNRKQNLNFYGVLLHVISDVVRMSLMLVVGVLVRCGLLDSTPMVDVICTFAVMGCIIVGSTWLLVIALRVHDVDASLTGSSTGTQYGAT